MNTNSQLLTYDVCICRTSLVKFFGGPLPFPANKCFISQLHESIKNAIVKKNTHQSIYAYRIIIVFMYV